MIIFSIFIMFLGVASIIFYARKSNKSLTKNYTVLKSYNFPSNKNSINYVNTHENNWNLPLDYHYNYDLITIYYNENSKKTYQLVSRNYSYYLIIYDYELNFLDEINLKLHHSAEVVSTAVMETFINDGKDYIILGLIDSHNVNYYHFDFNGRNVYKRHFSRINNKTFLIYHNENNFIPFLDECFCFKPIKIFWKKDEISFEILLSEDEIYPEKKWCGYEYIESVTKTNIANQFAFITHDPNYGVQGVKIFKINHSNNIDLIYDMDDLHFEGAFHNLSFNSKGDRFVLLLYKNNQFFKDSFAICEYSVLDNKKPLRIIKTKFGYCEFGPLHTRYITDSLICIIRNSDIIIYDLERKKLKQILKRDFRSPFHAGNNILIYQYKNEVVVVSY